MKKDVDSAASRPGAPRLDVKAALAAAKRAEKILADRERQAGREPSTPPTTSYAATAEAQQEALARRTAVRQDPAPSRRAMSLERNEPELEAER